MSAQGAPVTWAIVGLGTQAETMARALQSSTDGELIGVVSRTGARAKSFAAHHGVPYAASTLTELCALRRPDVVFISSPNVDHARQSMEAIELGCHVLCEKPMALNAADAAEVARAVQGAGVQYGVGFHLRFHPLVRRAHAWVSAGRIGTLQAVEAHWSVGLLHETALPSFTNPHKQWREDLLQSGGGASMARGVHLFDLVRFVAGVEAVDVTALHSPAAEGLPDLTSLTLLGCTSSVLVSVVTSRIIPAAKNRLVVYGSAGTLELIDAFRPDGRGLLRVSDGRDRSEEVLAREPIDLTIEEVAAFSAAVRGGSWMGATARDGVAATAIVEAEWAAVRTGRTQRVDLSVIA